MCKLSRITLVLLFYVKLHGTLILDWKLELRGKGEFASDLAFVLLGHSIIHSEGYGKIIYKETQEIRSYSFLPL